MYLKIFAKIMTIVTTLLITGMSGLSAQSSVPTQNAKQESIAIGFLNYLSQQDYLSAVGIFNHSMLEALPEGKLKATWESILQAYGGFQKIQGRTHVKVHNNDVINVECVFEKAWLEAKISFDRENKIAGLFFAPITQKFNYSPPDYVNLDAFVEKEINIKNGKIELPGTISIPKGKSPFPAVVLVHGSGPHDRNETIGGTQPFKDIAWGLSSKGIAVLRYDKRSKQYSRKSPHPKHAINVEQETVSDAAAAYRILRDYQGIDSTKIVVLGHSLGGMLIPKIAAKAPGATGFILMAANARPLEDLILEQHRYIFELDNNISDVEQARLDDLQLKIARVKQMPIDMNLKPGELPLNIPASYWASLQNYDQVLELQKLEKPVLLLHGERDFQVSMRDFAIWKQALTSKPNVKIKLLPKLNHLMITGESKSTLEEYNQPMHVNKLVIQTLVAWLKEQ